MTSSSSPPNIEGDPDGILSLSAALRSAADQVADIRSSLQTDGLQRWYGPGSDSFRNTIGEVLRPKLETVSTLIGEGTTLLQQYAPRLGDYQKQDATYKGQVATAQDNLADAQGRQAAASQQKQQAALKQSAAADPVSKQHADNLWDDAVGLFGKAEKDVDDLVNEIAGLIKQAWDNYEDFVHDAVNVAGQIGHAVQHLDGVFYGAVSGVVSTMARDELALGHDLLAGGKDLEHAAVTELDNHWTEIRHIIKDAAPFVGLGITLALFFTPLAPFAPLIGSLSGAALSDSTVAGDYLVGRSSDPNKGQRRLADADAEPDTIDGVVGAGLAFVPGGDDADAFGEFASSDVTNQLLVGPEVTSGLDKLVDGVVGSPSGSPTDTPLQLLLKVAVSPPLATPQTVLLPLPAAPLFV